MKLQSRRKSFCGRTVSGRIDWAGNETRACLYLGSCGFSYAYISQITNLSVGQIGNRLRIKQVKVGNYRNGDGRMAQKMIKGCIFLKNIGKDLT